MSSHSGQQTDTDYNLVVANVRKRLAVNKQRSYRFSMERFNLKKLNEVGGKEQYCVEVSNGFATLENLEMIRENINI
jgi:hypothetical protein